MYSVTIAVLFEAEDDDAARTQAAKIVDQVQRKIGVAKVVGGLPSRMDEPKR